MSDADIYLVGTGINFVQHLTPQAKDILERSAAVYHLTAFDSEIRELNANVINWQELYLQSDGYNVYRQMADILLEHARKENGFISFAIYGHPLVLVDTSQYVIVDAPSHGLSVETISGISSIDMILQYLSLDVGLAGLQILEAGNMLSKDISPNPCVSTIIMQIAAIQKTAINPTSTTPESKIELLQSHLLKAYHPGHPAVLITAPFYEGQSLIRHDTFIGELVGHAKDIHTGMSLYIPPGQLSVYQPSHNALLG